MTELLQTSSTTHLRHGGGRLVFSHVAGRTVVTESSARSPLRLLTPAGSGPGAWAFTSSYGGGLVAGDHISLNITAQPATTCYLSTQSSTKVYKSTPNGGARQSVRAIIEEDALLACCPDPLICFETAIYQQDQRFDLADSASLILLDWYTSGRHANGERWKFSRLESRNSIFVGDKHVLEDRLRLDNDPGPLTDKMRMGLFNCFATLVLIGPRVTNYAASLHQSVAAAPISPLSTGPQALLYGSSPLANGIILRVAGIRTEIVINWLRTKLHFLAELFGEHPWHRKW